MFTAARVHVAKLSCQRQAPRKREVKNKKADDTIGTRHILFALAAVSAASFPDDFNQHTFPAAAVEFAVEDLFPWAEVEPPVRDRDDDLPPP